jgi:glucokinase-like ROK family protein
MLINLTKKNEVLEFDEKQPLSFLGNIVGFSYPSPFGYYYRNTNKRLILDLIRFSAGGITRAEIARQMGLTRAAVTAIVNDILQEQLVRETDHSSIRGGRRPILLEINPECGHVAGIDMGATHLGILFTDFAGRVIYDVEIPFMIDQGPELCMPQVLDHFRQVLGTIDLSLKDILAVGIGVPGPVVAEVGAVSAPPIMPGWDKYPIRAHFQEVWNCPVSINNDAELGALGEWAYGAGRGESNLAYIKVGSGVGAGLLLDGRIYRGATGCAGEIGHVTILDGGPLCSCGNTGCLEALAGGRAIARKAREAIHADKRTILTKVQDVESITAKDVAQAARLGDFLSQQILADAGRYLGIAIASLVNLINPSIVVVGGGVAHMGDLLLEPIRQTLRERSLRSAAEAVRVTTALLGRRSTSMGAVLQALNLATQNLVDSPYARKIE